jgi:long-subunit acyl-CoA synthetase (AMP-forming)
MLDLEKYQSIGEALRDTLNQFANETCVIEADREREKERLTYHDFQQRGNAVARALQDAGFRPDDRAAIIMTNQSRWLISAYAIFFSGGVLVPLDYKLTPDEQWQLLAHSGASVLFTEYPVWRQLATAAGRSNAVNVKLVYVTEAPASADLDGAHHWEETQVKTQEPVFAPRKRSDLAYVSLVPLVLKNLQKGLQARFDALTPGKRRVFDALVGVNKALTKSHPRLGLSRMLLKQVHAAFGGELRAIIVGGAFTEPQTLQFFYDLGIPVANGYGLTEAGTAITVNDLHPFRADTVGKPLPGMSVRIVEPDKDGIGEVQVQSRTVMAGYLNEPELTAETIVDGWLRTGDLGRFDRSGHLQLFGRKKNMIVTEEGKNIYPEDIEAVFEPLPVKEFCVFAANYIWPKRSMVGEQLLLVVHLENGQNYNELKKAISFLNGRLLNYKRVHGIVVFEEDFPRTASMKIKRNVLAESLSKLDRASVVKSL